AADRERIRSGIIEHARMDPRITGGALTGSASVGREDAYSDIDLAFGVKTAADVAPTPAGSWIYRVFLLANTLQVDLAFAPASDFGARAKTFRLLFGEAATPPYAPLPTPQWLIGYAWLYALHVRSALARGKLWQAEYMLSAMRDQAFALACLRHGTNPREGRGMDELPKELRDRFTDALVRDIEPAEIARAFRAATALAIDEARRADAALADRIAPVMHALAHP